MELTDGTYCNINVIFQDIFPDYIEDFSSMIYKALASRSNIYVLLMPPKNAAMLIEQGYLLGLFVEGTQLFGTKDLLTSELFSHFTLGVDVSSAMKVVSSYKCIL